MLNRKQLNDYLEAYDGRIGIMRALNPPKWVKQLRDFVSQLDNDAPIDALKITELHEIVNAREADTVNARGELSAGALLAKMINDVSFQKVIHPFKELPPEHVLESIFTFLRPEQIAQLMTLSKKFKELLSKERLWKSAVQRHFQSTFDQQKSIANTNWLKLFGELHRRNYQDLDQRKKQLFSLVKLGDVTELQLLNLRLPDLYLVDGLFFALFNYTKQNQALCNYIFNTLIIPFYRENDKDELGLTLLHWAANLNQKNEIVKYLDNVNVTTNNGVTPFHMAARQGHLEVVMALIAAKATVDAACNNGSTPLFIAAQNGHLEVVVALIAANANVDVAHRTGVTPLYIAAQNGHLEVVMALIAAKATIAARHTGSTPLHIAAQYGHLEVVKALIAAKATINPANNDGVTPLHMAVENGNLEVVMALITANANVNAANNDGETSLHIAVQNGNLEVVMALITANANVNVAHRTGVTPLHMAAKNGDLEVVKALIAANANINSICNEGETPLDIAMRHKHSGVITLLSQAKLDLYIKEKSESTTLYKNSMTVFGKRFNIGYTSEQELAAAIILKAVVQGADSELLKEHRGALNQGDLKPLYRNLMRK